MSGNIRRSIAKAGLLVIALLAIFSTSVSARGDAVAKTTLTTGTVTATESDKAVRPLKRHSLLYVDDRVHTGSKSFAKIRYNDGGGMLLRPSSELLISKYQENGNDSGMTTELIKGGLRVVTGAISKDKPSSYRLKTPVATIGVRGTDFSPRYCQNDCNDFVSMGISAPPNGLYVGVTSGTIEVCNPAGCVIALAGQFVYVKNADTRPALLSEEDEEEEEMIQFLMLDLLPHPIDDDGLFVIPGNCDS